MPLNGLKNAEIPILTDYGGSAGDEFWKKFPRRELPVKVSTRVDVEKFKHLIDEVRHKMSATEVKRAERTVNDWRECLSEK